MLKFRKSIEFETESEFNNSFNLLLAEKVGQMHRSTWVVELDIRTQYGLFIWRPICELVQIELRSFQSDFLTSNSTLIEFGFQNLYRRHLTAICQIIAKNKIKNSWSNQMLPHLYLVQLYEVSFCTSKLNPFEQVGS